MMEEEKAIIPLPLPVELTQPFAVGQDNETSAPKISPPVLRQMRSESSMAGYVIQSILEPPTDDMGEPSWIHRRQGPCCFVTF
jgi:hypothetical protein